jgi:hypothetical protein
MRDAGIQEKPCLKLLRLPEGRVDELGACTRLRNEFHSQVAWRIRLCRVSRPPRMVLRLVATGSVSSSMAARFPSPEMATWSYLSMPARTSVIMHTSSAFAENSCRRPLCPLKAWQAM